MFQKKILTDSISQLHPATPLTVDAAASIAEAISIMTDNNKGSVIVLEKGQVVGIFTERDALMKVAGKIDGQ